MSVDSSDPRSIVTSTAFAIDPGLLGMPLARPTRRLWALGIDFALIALLTAALHNVSLLVWAVIALVLVRLALKRSPSMTAAAGMLMRTSFGCLGVAILTGVLIALGVARMTKSERGAALSDAIERGAALAPEDMRMEIAGADYRNAKTADEALAVMTRAATTMKDVPPSVRRRLLKAAVPKSAPWAPQADSLIALAVGSDAAKARATFTAADSAAAEEVAGMSDAEVLAALGADASKASLDDPRGRALRARATRLLAADTIEALDRRVDRLQDQLDDEKKERDAAQKELTESRTGVAAFAVLLRDMWKQLGSAFGLWSLYFTVLTSMWKGQTIGKRLMRVRVVRLDGHPIGWWSAFERAGGYVAGLATGLLGFAQVLWDPNRQCIHDKIVGTVVVVDGAHPVEGAWVRRTKP